MFKTFQTETQNIVQNKLCEQQSDYPDEVLEVSIENSYALLAASDMNTSRNGQENVGYRNALQVELGSLDSFMPNGLNGGNIHISEARKEVQQKRAEERKRKKSKSVHDMNAHRALLPVATSNPLGSNKNSRHYRNKLSREPKNHVVDAFVSANFLSPPPIRAQRCDEQNIDVSPTSSGNDQ